ncbi:hypothetical protein IGI37_000997 [Enterococcus sp. AZ194]
MTSLPTMIGTPKKATYHSKKIVSDATIEGEIKKQITTFLDTFFKLYPTASEKELEYYVDGQALTPIDFQKYSL